MELEHQKYNPFHHNKKIRGPGVKKTVRRGRRFFRNTAIALAILTLTGGISVAAVGMQIPETFFVKQGGTLLFQNRMLNARSKENVEEVSLASVAGSSYETEIRLFGLIPVKTVAVNVIEEHYAVPGGTPFGIKMETDGVIVVGVTDVQTPDATVNPAAAAGIKKGDIITEADGHAIKDNEAFAEILRESAGEAIPIVYERGGEEFETELTPAKSSLDNLYKAGLWVRDSTAGIGTITFCDSETGLFGGLGHGICDVDTSELMPLGNGEVVDVAILGCIPGREGAAGELQGYFPTGVPIGELAGNTDAGVYGTLYSPPSGDNAVPIALKQEIATGKAQIIATIDDTGPQYFDIEIEHVSLNEAQKTKNMVIRVTDEDLLSVTGGIVQGMSGSPILQEGKLVGAVTHVFLNEPERGYGIFAENMINELQELQKTSMNAG